VREREREREMRGRDKPKLGSHSAHDHTYYVTSSYHTARLPLGRERKRQT